MLGLTHHLPMAFYINRICLRLYSYKVGRYFRLLGFEHFSSFGTGMEPFLFVALT
jgi:hypothetical protein